MLVIPPAIREHIARHGAAEFPRECCGILLGRHTSGGLIIDRALPAKNIAPADRAHDRYIIDPLAILHADRAAQSDQLELVGFYHSHPNHPAVPSKTDIELAWLDYLYLIASITAAGLAELRAWRLDPATQTMREIIARPDHSLAKEPS
jgi:proteasome lid subunit RPN8/RPN11